MTMLAHPVLVVTSPFPLCVMVPGSSNAKMFQYVRGVPSCLGRRVIRDVYPPSSHSFVLLYLYPLPNVGIDHPTVMSLFNSFFFSFQKRTLLSGVFSSGRPADFKVHGLRGALDNLLPTVDLLRFLDVTLS